MEKLKYILLIILIFAIPANSISKGKALTPVKLQLKWKHQFQFAGYYAAIEKGYYKDAGLQVELIEASDNYPPSLSVINGNAQFGITATDVILMRVKGEQVVVLSTIFQHSAQILLSKKTAGIKHVHDLIGKNIMIEPHAANIEAYIIDEGLLLDSINLIPHSFDVNMLINDSVDAMTAYLTDEPFLLKEKNIDYNILTPTAGGIDFYGDVLITTEQLMLNNPKLVLKFRNASLKGWEYALQHSDEIIDLIYNKYSKRHSKSHLAYEAEKMKSLINSNVVEIGYTNTGRWQHIYEVYKQLGMISADEHVEIDELFYTYYLTKKANIHWKFIFVFIVAFIVVGLITLLLYTIIKKLKNEISNTKHLSSEIQKLSAAIEQSSNTIVITDINGNIEYTNPHFTILTGYTAEEAKGKNPRILNANTQSTEYYAKMWQTISAGNTWKGEFHNIAKDRTPFWENVTITPIKNSKGKITNYLAIKEDYTAKRAVKIALEQSEQKLKESIKTKDKFFAIIAHDLKGPISALSNYSKLLLENFDEYDTQKQKQFISVLQDSIGNTYKLLDNLLHWSRSQRGTIEFVVKRINLYSTINEIIAILNQSAKSKLISIINRVAEDCYVKADGNMLHTILRNLISNAIKFTPENGEVVISSQSLKSDDNTLFAKISVKDNGVGIEPKNQSKIFDISENIKTKGTKNEGGTGLGLILCREFVKRHCGKIWVESEVGAGSEFIFTLPQNL